MHDIKVVYDLAQGFERQGDRENAGKMYALLSDMYLVKARESSGPDQEQMAAAAERARVLATNLAGAVAKTIPSSASKNSLNLPPMRPIFFRDIQGLEQAKKVLWKNLILPQKYPDIFSALHIRPTHGFFFVGPPGTGKTMLAHALANELGIGFVPVNAASILGMYVGQSESNICSAFAQARQMGQCVLFLDEAEAICNTRSADSDVIGRVVSMLAQEMENPTNEGVIVIGATNYPERIDARLLRPGRFTQWVYIDLPNEDARREIAQARLDQIPTEMENLPQAIAAATAQNNAADVAQLSECVKVETGVRIAFAREHGDQIPVCILEADFSAALQEHQSTAFEADRNRCRNFILHHTHISV